MTMSAGPVRTKNRPFATLPEPYPLWCKDAVFDELHEKTFRDGDGIGDFLGPCEELDCLQELAVTAIWILPIYPSPLRDDGYDISEYTGIHPMYGTLSDFKTLLTEAPQRGLRIITKRVLIGRSEETRRNAADGRYPAAALVF